MTRKERKKESTGNQPLHIIGFLILGVHRLFHLEFAFPNRTPLSSSHCNFIKIHS